MADLSDVEQALATLITEAIYPSGINAPSATGGLVRIYRGWPNQSALNADLALGTVTITIFPEPTRHKITTRYIDPPNPDEWITPSLTVTMDRISATFAGVASPGQIAGVLVDNTAFVHRTTIGDTPERVAATLATTIRTRRAATATGATVSVPGCGSLIGRVVADQRTQTETRRQSQGLRISLWCPTPTIRDQISALVDLNLSAQTFLPLADGTTARLSSAGTTVFDQSQNAGLYRRDLLLDAEYATTVTTIQPALIFGDARLQPNAITASSLLG